MWTLPLAAALAIVPLYWGHHGCSFAVSADARAAALAPHTVQNTSVTHAFVVVGALLAAAVVFVRWGRLAVRLLVGLSVGGIVSGYLIFHPWTMKLPVVTRSVTSRIGMGTYRPRMLDPRLSYVPQNWCSAVAARRACVCTFDRAP